MSLEFRSKLKQMINDDKLDKDEVFELMGNLDKIIQNEKFMDGFMQLVHIICEERDGEEGFTVNDLKVLQKELNNANFVIITQIVNAIILLVTSIPNINVDLTNKESEELVLNILLYLMLIEVPKKIGGLGKLSKNEKNMLVDIIVSLYNSIKSAQVMEGAVEYFKNLFKSGSCNNFCSCICSQKDSNAVTEKELNKIKLNLNSAVHTMRTIITLEDTINDLKKEIRDIKHGNEPEKTKDSEKVKEQESTE